MRVKRDGELFGVVTERLPDLRYRVIAEDGKSRICNKSGKLRRMRVKQDDLVLITKWIVQSDKKGTLRFVYNRNEAHNMKEVLPDTIKGILW